MEEYSFCPDPAKAPFRVIASSNPNYTHCSCGVSTWDAVLIQKYLDNPLINPLPVPYGVIAANTYRALSNNQQVISKSDARRIQECLLEVYSDFGPYGSPSFWYINDNFVFPPGTTDYLNGAAAAYEHQNTVNVPTTGSETYGNFLAVKMGDVNQSCKCDNQNFASRQQSNNYLAVPNYKINVEQGKLFLPIWSNSIFDFAAVQAGFRFDPSRFTLKSVHVNTTLPISDENFGLNKIEQGEIRFVWIPLDGSSTLPKKDLLFTLEFEIRNESNWDDVPLLWVSDNILQSVVYDGTGQEFSIQLDLKKEGAPAPKINIIVNPNPFIENVKAIVFTQNEGRAIVRLSDSNGKMYVEEAINLKMGENLLDLQAENNIPAGVYIISIDLAGQKVHKKILKL